MKYDKYIEDLLEEITKSNEVTREKVFFVKETIDDFGEVFFTLEEAEKSRKWYQILTEGIVYFQDDEPIKTLGRLLYDPFGWVSVKYDDSFWEPSENESVICTVRVRQKGKPAKHIIKKVKWKNNKWVVPKNEIVLYVYMAETLTLPNHISNPEILNYNID